MITLPKAPIVGDTNKLDRLIIISHQGIGKSSAVAQLPNSLIIDLEGGTGQITASKLDLQKMAAEQNVTMGSLLSETITEIKKANAANGGKAVYDYIVIDGVTALARLARLKATAGFRNSVMGKGMVAKGTIINDVITDVPESGWMWYFKAFDDLDTSLQGLAGKCLIYLAHSKQGSLMKDGVKLDANDMNLERKLSLDLLRGVDACGMAYRKDANTVVVSFKQNDKDLTIKCRVPRLSDREVILSEKDEKGNIITHWEEIFNDL